MNCGTCTYYDGVRCSANPPVIGNDGISYRPLTVASNWCSHYDPEPAPGTCRGCVFMEKSRCLQQPPQTRTPEEHGTWELPRVEDDDKCRHWRWSWGSKVAEI